MNAAIDTAKQAIPKTFDTISKRYDIINRILSLGLDLYWRKKVARHLPIHPAIRLLDLATGTADQIISIMNSARNIKSAIGIDLSKEMLSVGKRKLTSKPYSHQVSLLEADACNIPLNSDTIDCVTMSYGIRNVPDVKRCLRECHRVLSHRGRLLILEFSLPKNPWIRWAHGVYLKAVVPFLGGLLSRNFFAYSYLNKTIESFPYGRSFCALLEEAGFATVKAHPLSFGITTLYVAEKIDESKFELPQ